MDRGPSVKAHMEKQLQAMRSMGSLEILEVGLLHDLNNLLTMILGISDTIKSYLPEDSELLPYLERIDHCAEYASNLAPRIMSCSRRLDAEPDEIDINEVVRGNLIPLRHVIGERIEVTTVFSEDRPLVCADAVQMTQVLMNLCFNAKDAMPAGGRLLLETRSVEVDEQFESSIPHVKAGRYVLLSVSDTGTGMDERTMKRAFDPFFTTKEPGKGTGLGLSTVYGIVRNHNGFIDLSSKPGEGTTVDVYLPAIETYGLDTFLSCRCPPF